MVRKILVIVAMLASCASAEARGRRFQSARAAQATYERPQSTSEPVDATDEVNALRVSRGVPPLIRDELLVQGAMACAKYRGSRSMFGHLSTFERMDELLRRRAAMEGRRCGLRRRSGRQSVHGIIRPMRQLARNLLG